MKKRFYSCAFAMLVLMNCFSQKAKNSFSFAIGPAIPTGNFAKKELPNSAAGFASTGLQGRLLYQHKLNKSVSLAANLAGQLNPINTSAFEEQLSRANFLGFYFTASPRVPSPASGYKTYTGWQVEKKSWFNTSLTVGIITSLPVNTNWRLVVNAGVMAGAMRLVSPAIKASINSDTLTALLEQGKVAAVGFCYQLSGGLKYKLTDKFFFAGEIAWLAANNVTFNSVTSRFFVNSMVNSSPQVSEIRSSSSTKQQLTTLNLSAGIGIVF